MLVDLEGRHGGRRSAPLLGPGHASRALSRLPRHRRRGPHAFPRRHAWAQAGREIPCFGTTHADYFHGACSRHRVLSSDEIDEDYEVNTGHSIVRQSSATSIPLHTPAVLVAGHAPFCWGTTPARGGAHRGGAGRNRGDGAERSEPSIRRPLLHPAPHCTINISFASMAPEPTMDKNRMKSAIGLTIGLALLAVSCGKPSDPLSDHSEKIKMEVRCRFTP